MGTFSTTSFLGALLAFIFGTGFAKGMQAFVAYRLGDRLPRSEGRMSFSPTRHMEPLGLLLALLLGLGVPVITWGKPLNLNPFANRLKRIGGSLIALTGFLSYVFLGVIAGLIFRSVGEIIPTFFAELLIWFTYFNFLLAAFNVIPIPPLDGYGFIKGFLSPNWDAKLLWLETYGPVLILVLALILPYFLGGLNGNFNILYQFIFGPIVRFFLGLLGLTTGV
jgi:Zn-dependent protease